MVFLAFRHSEKPVPLKDQISRLIVPPDARPVDMGLYNDSSHHLIRHDGYRSSVDQEESARARFFELRTTVLNRYRLGGGTDLDGDDQLLAKSINWNDLAEGQRDEMLGLLEELAEAREVLTQLIQKRVGKQLVMRDLLQKDLLRLEEEAKSIRKVLFPKVQNQE